MICEERRVRSCGSTRNVLDLTEAYTNDIHAMAGVYGIDAAYHAIIKVGVAWYICIGKEINLFFKNAKYIIYCIGIF